MELILCFGSISNCLMLTLVPNLSSVMSDIISQSFEVKVLPFLTQCVDFTRRVILDPPQVS